MRFTPFGPRRGWRAVWREWGIDSLVLFACVALLAVIALTHCGCALNAEQDYRQDAIGAASQPTSAPIAAQQGAGNMAAQAQVDAAATVAATGIAYTSSLGIGATVLIGLALVLTLVLSHRREMARILRNGKATIDG